MQESLIINSHTLHCLFIRTPKSLVISCTDSLLLDGLVFVMLVVGLSDLPLDDCIHYLSISQKKETCYTHQSPRLLVKGAGRLGKSWAATLLASAPGGYHPARVRGAEEALLV